MLHAECSKVKDRQVSHIRCLIEGALFRELGERQLAVEVCDMTRGTCSVMYDM